jgi:hypothetical protein
MHHLQQLRHTSNLTSQSAATERFKKANKLPLQQP